MQYSGRRRRQNQKDIHSLIVGILCGIFIPYALRCIWYKHNVEYVSQSDDYLHQLSYEINHQGSSFLNQLILHEDRQLAWSVNGHVRILCIVVTQPSNHKTKARYVRMTWGRHCNTLLFVSEDDGDTEIPIIKVAASSGRGGLWAKTVEAFKYVYQYYHKDYDWILKADDDTYVIIENLRLMLLPYSPMEPIQFGFYFIMNGGYVSGGAGYVMSREAVDRLINQAFDGKNAHCVPKYDTGHEDVNIARCLEAVGVQIGDSRDTEGRHRFFPLDAKEYSHFMRHSSKNIWLWYYTYWPLLTGEEGWSNTPISFHYVDPSMMLILEFLIYSVKVVPVRHLNQQEDFGYRRKILRINELMHRKKLQLKNTKTIII